MLIPTPIDPLSAQELAQELALVSRALFTQLMPGSADHALSGVPGMQGHGTSAGTPVAVPAPVPTPVPQPTTPLPQEVVPAAAPPIEHPVPAPPSLPVPPAPAEVQIELGPAPSVARPASGGASLPLIEAIEAIEVIEVLEVLAAPDDVPAVEPPSMRPRPPQTDRRSQDMLTEIGFLDDEGDSTEGDDE
jgi:hypothetical protein